MPVLHGCYFYSATNQEVGNFLNKYIFLNSTQFWRLYNSITWVHAERTFLWGLSKKSLVLRQDKLTLFDIHGSCFLLILVVLCSKMMMCMTVMTDDSQLFLWVLSFVTQQKWDCCCWSVARIILISLNAYNSFNIYAAIYLICTYFLTQLITTHLLASHQLMDSTLPTFRQCPHSLAAVRCRAEGGGSVPGREQYFPVCSEKVWRSGFKFKSTSPNLTGDNWLQHSD